MFWRKRKLRECDLDKELCSHLKLEAEEQRENGLSEEEASYAARRAFGNATLVREDVRCVWIATWLERLNQDLGYALRSFAHTPGFTAIVVVTLALGIGATTAMFSIVNALLLHPLPYRNADRLVVIWELQKRDPKGPPVFDSYQDFEIWKSKSRSFEQLAPATWATGGRVLTGIGRARAILAQPVGIDLFSMLGIAPELGRTFEPDDLHRECTVVLKHDFWVTALGSSKNVAGRHIELDRNACTIVGVMPREFTFYPDVAPMWMLITPDSAIARDPENSNVGVFGLLKHDVSIERAQQEIETLYKNAHKGDPGGVKRIPVVHPLAEQFAYLTGPNLRLSVTVLFGAVTFVLLIACVNIANLLLGRSFARQKELAVRAALGSGRLRLVRQLLTESLLLSSGGAIAGTLLAFGAVHYFKVTNPIALPPGNPVAVNSYVLGFTAVLTIITAILFGLVPAWKASRVDLIDALRASGKNASFSPATRTFGRVLVSAEVMLSMTLLVGAGLLSESVNRLAGVPLGFKTDHILTLQIELPKWSYLKAEQRARFYREILDRALLPGVESAALASSLPLNKSRFGGSTLAVEAKPQPDSTAIRDTAEVSITSDYFRVMGVPLEEGRFFDTRDRENSEPVAIVSAALVRKYFAHEDPIGKRIRVGEPNARNPWLTIVGVSAEEKDQNFFHQMTWEDIPMVFRPIGQDPPFYASLVLRTLRHDEATLGLAIQKQVAAVDASVPVDDVQNMNAQRSRALAYPRFRAVVLGTFAGLALLLAAVGLYGVLSQLIAQRTQEFGVRMAVGAQTRDILGLVIRQGMLLTLAGLAAGLAVALSLMRVLSSLLYGITATDPWTLATVRSDGGAEI